MGKKLMYFELEPVASVEEKGTGPNGAKLIECTGGDPQMRIKLEGLGAGPSVRPGWHAVEIDAKPIDRRRPVDPVLYLDYGAGVSEATKIALLTDSDTGALARTVVAFAEAPSSIRFDPSIGPCAFELSGVRIVPLSRISAAREMVSVALAAQKTAAARVRLLGEFVAALFSGGPRRVGNMLRERYLVAANHDVCDYDAWVALYGDLPGSHASQTSQLSDRPLFSIVMPTYNTPGKWLARCIDSVKNQSYPYWELCIADDASPDPRVREMIEGYMAQDARIKAIFRPDNGHISASSNDALNLATGKYVVLLDHDDELHQHALLEMAKAFDANPNWRMAYSDEDKIDENGRRFDPYFKPDWNYDLFLSHNCISHLGVYERALIEGVGRFRKGYEGSQDWDLALRCIEQLRDDQVGHVPHVLYHWRAIPGSTALAPGEKNYAHVAAMKSIQSHLDRIGRDAEVLELPQFAGNYRVRNRLPSVLPSVSLIIPTRDRADLLEIAVSSILSKTNYDNYEIVIVDNQSVEDETLDLFERLRRDPRVRILSYDSPFNYSAINNYAVSLVSSAVVGLLNNDIEVISPDWLLEMVSQAIRVDVGAVGAMLYFPNDTIQHAGVILGFNGVGVHAYADRPRGWVGMMLRAQLIQNYSAVTAACMLIRRETYTQVGGMDEDLAVAYNDVDFCLRVRSLGLRNVWTPYAELYHHESASRGSDMSEEKRARFDREAELFQSRWQNLMAFDPAYNPNLATTGSTFDLAFPPRANDAMLIPSKTERNLS